MLTMGSPAMAARMEDHEAAALVVRHTLVAPATRLLGLTGSISNGVTNGPVPASVSPLTASEKLWPPLVLFMKCRFCQDAYWEFASFGLMAQQPPSPVKG